MIRAGEHYRLASRGGAPLRRPRGQSGAGNRHPGGKIRPPRRHFHDADNGA
jgi:hypothetical protein